MTHKQRRLNRIRAIEREFRVASIAADGLDDRLRGDPSALNREQLKFVDYRNFRESLEPTYLIRLFAEFEAGLRQAWEFAFRRTTSPGVQDLIDSLYTQCFIAADWRDCAHRVRKYRNALVHEGGDDGQAIGIREACRDLRRFFSHLPYNLSHNW
jgi:hypothetical protein